jgi:hypothetical protein
MPWRASDAASDHDTERRNVSNLDTFRQREVTLPPTDMMIRPHQAGEAFPHEPKLRALMDWGRNRH